MDFNLRMPPDRISDIIVEEFLGSRKTNDNIVEITVAVLGRTGQMVSMVPSETLNDFGVLTVEEKFCKGGGTNLTPPPSFSSEMVYSIQKRISAFSNQLGIDGYARIDAMYNIKSDELILIEVNSLPGLSPATVTFTQALVTPGIRKKPSEFLKTLVDLKLEAIG